MKQESFIIGFNINKILFFNYEFDIFDNEYLNFAFGLVLTLLSYIKGNHVPVPHFFREDFQVVVTQKFFLQTQQPLFMSKGSFSYPRDISQLVKLYPHYVRDIRDFLYDKKIRQHKYADVWVALDKRSGRTVSVKQLHPGAMTGRRIVMYAREIHTLASSNSSYISELIGFTVDDPYAIIVDSKTNGQLSRYINTELKSNPPSGTFLTRTIYAIAYGMHYLHSLGFIHRDLKPSNIYFDNDMNPCICDAWNSRPFTRKRNMTRMIGTLNVMAPELMTDHSYDFKVDIYSYGMVCYMISEQKYPFADEEDTAIIKHISEEQERPDFSDKTCEKIRNLISSCWNPAPLERPDFDTICERIESGEHVFPDTDMDELQEYIDNLKTDSEEREAHPSPLPPIYVNIEAILEKISRPKQKKPVNYQFRSDDAEFRTKIEKALENLEIANFGEFYQEFSQFLENDPNTNAKVVFLNTFLKTVKSNHHFLDALCHGGFYEIPALRTNDLLETTFNFLALVFIERPVLANTSMKSLLKVMINEKPRDMIVLFYHYTMALDRISKPLPIIDIFMAKYDVYIDNECGSLYIRVFYNLLKTNEMFQTNRFTVTRKYLAMFLKSNYTNVLVNAYKAIINLYDSEFFVSFETVLQHLSRPALRSLIFSLLLRINILPVSTRFAEYFFPLVNSEPRAALVLLRYVDQSQDGAISLLKNTSWMRIKFKNPMDPLKIIFVIMKYPTLRPKLQFSQDLPFFLCHLMQLKSDVAMSYVCTIIIAMDPTPKWLYTMNCSKFIKYFCNAGQAIATPSVQKAFLLALENFIQTSYAEPYNSLIKKLVEILSQQNEVSILAINMLVEFARFPEMLPDLKRYGINSYFEKIRTNPNYEEIANEFFKNIKMCEEEDNKEEEENNGENLDLGANRS